MERPTCKTCAFWDWEQAGGDSLIDESSGFCMRHAPREVLAGEGDLVHDSPLIYGDRWCGEHHLFPAYIASLGEGGN
jgi:hypothetical protein